MTLDEMKLAVCAKLSGVVDVSNDGQGPCYWPDRHTKEINWPTEGLQVCHEAEKMLNDGALWKGYCNRLWDVVCPQRPQLYGLDAATCLLLLHATYSQRLEALCRVWYPERFTT